MAHPKSQFRLGVKQQEKVKKVAAIIHNEMKDFKGPFSSWPPPSN